MVFPLTNLTLKIFDLLILCVNWLHLIDKKTNDNDPSAEKQNRNVIYKHDGNKLRELWN